MQSSNHIALKEWAVVCAALEQGTQQILFRKGGIHEGASGFLPEHREFWLFPTGFHQSVEGVRPEFASAAVRVLDQAPQPDYIFIRSYCTVDSVHWIDDASRLDLIRPYHVLTDEAVAKRFYYRQPGVYVMVVRTWQLAEPLMVPANPRYDGCHSWVELNESLSTQELKPIVPDSQSAPIEEIEEILSGK